MVIRFKRETFTASQKKTLRSLGVSKGQVRRAVGDAWFQFMSAVVGLARDRAPSGETGNLRDSAFVERPVFRGDMVIVAAGFRVIYARMRDLGTEFLPGGVLRPVRAEALFIPLHSGVFPHQSGLIFGVDFVLAKEVRQEGTRYWTGTLEEVLPNTSRIVGKVAFSILRRRTPRG